MFKLSSTHKLSKMILAAVLSVAGLSGCTGTKEIKIGTGDTGGAYYAYGTELADLMNQQGGKITYSVKETAGSAANLRLLKDNYIQMAVVQSDTLNDAWNGAGVFNGEGGYSDIRAIAGLYTEACQIVVPRDSDINDVSDLAGKRVSIGEEESGVYTNAVEILEAYGLTLNDLNASRMSFTESADAMKNGELDAFFCTAGAPTSAVAELSSSMEIRLLSLDERAITYMQNLYGGYTVTTVPANTYNGQSEETTTIGVKAVLVTRSEVADSTIQNVTKTLFEHTADLQQVWGVTDQLTETFAVSDSSIPFHNGAIAYYTQHGISFSDEGTVK